MKRLILVIFISLSTQGYAQHWAPFGTPNWEVRCMFSDTDENVLYVGGGFATINGQQIRGIGKWDGSQWHDLDLGMDTIQQSDPNNVLAITKYNGEIIAGGAFFTAGGANSRYISRWDGSQWHPFNGQPNNAVLDLLVYNNQLYVVGAFDSLGTIEANGIGMWDGTNWHAVGNFPGYQPAPSDEDIIYTVQNFQGNLYICGLIEDTDHYSTYRLAWFDGTTWHRFQDDLKGSFSFGEDWEIYNDELYLCGNFPVGAGNHDNCIQRWNGTSWSSVGGGTVGVNPSIHQLKTWKGKLYAVGAFTQAGGISASKIAYWNGIQWCSLGSGFDNDIGALAFFKDTLYVGGGFKVIDGDSIIRLAKWIGGDYIASCSSPVGVSEINQTNFDFSIYPNPATSLLEIILPKDYHSQQLKIKNTLGQVMKQEESSSTQISIDISDLPAGLYFIELQNVRGRLSKKFVKN